MKHSRRPEGHACPRPRERPSELKRRRARAASGAVALICGALTLAFSLGGCGDTLQDQPIASNTLEKLLVAPYPVYWAGRSFQGLAIMEATRDPGGAFSVQYGDCVEGGQSTCVPALRVVTSPDNSFLPGGSTPQRLAPVRGVGSVIAQRGRTIEVPTGGVVVSIYANSARLAAAAAQTVVPINEAGVPGAPLPVRLRDTGFGSTPLPSQEPSPLRALR
ncbi:MAG TPA: hypothetical protein VG188_02810 [Solirubrobacteraceae bacterium]|jgi:hypothetical protein|nr:hypothetical protein [Solirubrobacteraceae bacterium]